MAEEVQTREDEKERRDRLVAEARQRVMDHATDIAMRRGLDAPERELER